MAKTIKRAVRTKSKDFHKKGAKATRSNTKNELRNLMRK